MVLCFRKLLHVATHREGISLHYIRSIITSKGAGKKEPHVRVCGCVVCSSHLIIIFFFVVPFFLLLLSFQPSTLFSSGEPSLVKYRMWAMTPAQTEVNSM